MFTVLLAVKHDEDRALKQATAITDAPLEPESVEAIVVHVAREVQSDEGGKLDLQEYSDRPESVDLVVDELEAAGIDVRLEQRSGDPAAEIFRVARDGDVDQIVVGGKKRSPVGKAVFGSVVQEIILNSEYPVLVANE